jgi:hypothetical protein
MLIIKKEIYYRIQQYLTHKITIDELVDWAERSMMEDEFDENDMDVIRNVVGRLGLADVKSFGLTWDECETLINELGFKVKFEFEFA